jgi:hypothetical protein
MTVLMVTHNVFAATYGEAGRSRRALFLFGVAAAVLMLAAVLAALGATALVSAPLPAFLVALLLAATPLLAGAGGSLMFPYARWQSIPLAGLAACLVAIAMPLASWVADTRGEPGGRGRRLRSALVLGALLLSMLGFAALAPSSSAPTLLRLVLGHRSAVGDGHAGAGRARSPWDHFPASPPSVMANGPAGFLLVRSGERRAFLARAAVGGWDAAGGAWQ